MHFYNFEKPIEAGIFSFKNLNNGFLSMNFSANYRNPENNITEDKLEDFMFAFKDLLSELYNPEVSFLEPADLPY